ncbi:MAG: hypothetical protein CYG60_07085 [Actinobacteria bacterium]|nr:MAG: hypothetical protein CYG60_07085 [Actinomycetota bacterium]
MFYIEAFSAWLTDQGVTAPHAYNRTPMLPDRIVTITETGGPPSIDLEDATEIVALQIRCRSPEDAPHEARDLALQIDRIVMDAPRNSFSLAGYRVISTGRMGGRPAYMSTDHQERTTYVCNYWLEIER